MSADSIFRAAARGDVDEVRRCIEVAEAEGTTIVDVPDEAGRTACFYAQMMDQAEVVSVLQAKGWTTMDDGNLFRTAGGRVCFWKEPKLPRARGTARPPAPARSSTDAQHAHLFKISSSKSTESSKSARVQKVMARRKTRDEHRGRVTQLSAASSLARRESDLPVLEATDVHESDVLAYHVRGQRRAWVCRLRTSIASVLTHHFQASIGDVIEHHDLRGDLPAREAEREMRMSTPGARVETHFHPSSLDKTSGLDKSFDLASEDWPELPAKDAASLDAHTATLRKDWTVLCGSSAAPYQPARVETTSAWHKSYSLRASVAARVNVEDTVGMTSGEEDDASDETDWVHVHPEEVPAARFRILQGFM
mmetsp:Transcript_5469/g.15067  ORF Transcript_5469/g.15067 Transcript_5469/m.15067 type:complete len:365 (+) Transcript_5469:224-1318(+)